MFGLSQQDIQAICGCFARFPAIRKVIIYGSRAKGNYKPGSDIDLTICDDQFSLADLMRLEVELDDLLLPYKIDLSLKSRITNPELIDHIERIGKVFYPPTP